MKFKEFLKLISKIKNIPLQAEASHFKMMPPHRKEQLKNHDTDFRHAKQAGVLILFYPDERRQTKLILILRKTYKGVHSAQVALPGGKLENQDASLKETALRETFEEVGVPVNHIRIVKEISQIYISPSNFYVYPFIGITTVIPKFIKQDDEVEQLIEVDLDDFLDEKSIVKKYVKTFYSVDVEVPAFKLNKHIVWGATAMILSEAKDLLKKVY